MVGDGVRFRMRPVFVVRRTWHWGHVHTHEFVQRSDMTRWRLFGPCWLRLAVPRRPIDFAAFSLRVACHVWWVCRVADHKLVRYEAEEVPQ